MKEMKIKLYKILSNLLFPFFILFVAYKLLKDKEKYIRIKEILGYPSIKRSNNDLIWVHAASVGEIISILPIIKLIKSNYTNINILVTTGTSTSAKLIRDKYSKYVIHQYLPIDNYFCIKKFLNYWKPGLILWVESEFWPNLLLASSKICPIINVNGRISDNSYKKWSKNKDFIKTILDSFSLVIAQSKQDRQKYLELGAQSVLYCGNIKFSYTNEKIDTKEINILKERIGGRRVLLAVSTHQGEEEQIANVHEHLKKIYPDLLTFIAPRHPNRRKEIVDLLTDPYQLNISIRSFGDIIHDNTDIYLIDTIGELNIFYNLSHIVFIGGSLVDKGGHNFMIPARYNNLIVFGPFMGNFKEIAEDFVNARAAIQIQNDEELYLLLKQIFAHLSRIETYSNEAKKIIKKSENIINDVYEKIDPFIKRIF